MSDWDSIAAARNVDPYYYWKKAKPVGKPETFLAKLREWEKGAPTVIRAKVDCRSHGRHCWSCRLSTDKRIFNDSKFIRTRTTTQVEGWGKTREEACGLCYGEAVRRGIIEDPSWKENPDYAPNG